MGELYVIIFIKSQLYSTSHTIPTENHPWVWRYRHLTLILAAMTPPPPPLSFSFFVFLSNEHADAYTYKLSSRVLFLTDFTLPLPVLVSSGCCEAMTVVLAVDCEVTLAQLHWDTAVQQRSKAETRAKEISNNRQLSILIASIVFHYFLLTSFSTQIISFDNWVSDDNIFFFSYWWIYSKILWRAGF